MDEEVERWVGVKNGKKEVTEGCERKKQKTKHDCIE